MIVNHYKPAICSVLNAAGGLLIAVAVLSFPLGIASGNFRSDAEVGILFGGTIFGLVIGMLVIGVAAAVKYIELCAYLLGEIHKHYLTTEAGNE